MAICLRKGGPSVVNLNVEHKSRVAYKRTAWLTVVFSKDCKKEFQSAQELHEYVKKEEQQGVINKVSGLARKLLNQGGWTVQHAVDEAMLRLLSTEVPAQDDPKGVYHKFLQQRPQIVQALEKERPLPWRDVSEQLRAVQEGGASEFFT